MRVFLILLSAFHVAYSMRVIECIPLARVIKIEKPIVEAQLAAENLFCEKIKKKQFGALKFLSEIYDDVKFSGFTRCVILKTLMNEYADDALAESIYNTVKKHELQDNVTLPHEIQQSYQRYYNRLTLLSPQELQDNFVAMLQKKEVSNFTVFMKTLTYKSFFEKQPLAPEHHKAVVEIILNTHKNFTGTFLISAAIHYGLNLKSRWSDNETIVEHIANDASDSKNFVIFNEAQKWLINHE